MKLLNNFGLLKKRSNSVSRLSTVVDPLDSLFSVDLDISGIGKGIVVANLFDELTVAGRSLVCNNYAIEG